jgi:hypothetical protein
MQAQILPDKKATLETLLSVNKYFMRKNPDPGCPTFVRNKMRPSHLWTRAVYYEGVMALYEIYPIEELYEYTYEMYEAEGGECVLAASRNIDVYDVMNWSINFKSLTVFLHETDQYTDIFTETFISQQDHPSDTGLVRLRYNGKDFAEEDGIRTGFWYTEDGVRCMQPVSAEALHYLSDNFPTEDRFWTDLVTADTEEDETFIKVRDEKLGQLGLKLVKTRQDFTDSYSVEEMNDEQLAQMDIDFAAISAIDCYMPAGGTETRLAFITEYTDRLMDEDGMTNINRLVSLEKIAVE